MTRCLILALLVGSSGLTYISLAPQLLELESICTLSVHISIYGGSYRRTCFCQQQHCQFKLPGYCARSSSSFLGVLVALFLKDFAMRLGG